MGFKAKPTPSFITLIYLLLGILWVLFSDYVSLAFLIEPSNHWFFQNIREISFLAASGILIFFMTYSYGKDYKVYNSKLEDKLKEEEELNQQIQNKLNKSIGLVSNLIGNKNSTTKNGSVQKSLDDFQSRIQLISFIHKQFLEKTVSSKVSVCLFIEYLADHIQSKFNATKGDILVIQKVESISCELKEAILTSLIVNELISNVYHHAFTDQKEGKLYVNMHKEDGNIHLVIADNGKGLSSDFNPSEAKTSGMNLIHVLLKDLNGKMTYKSKPHKGTKFEITIPSEKKEAFNSINEQWS